MANQSLPWAYYRAFMYDLVECPPFNGGSLLLAGTTVVVSEGVDVYFWVGEDYIENIILEYWKNCFEFFWQFSHFITKVLRVAFNFGLHDS